MNNKLFSFNFRKMMRCTGILMAALVMTLVACRSNETHRTRLTQTEMETYGKAIAGQYEGSYVILWANSSMPWHETEDGRKVRENVRETVEDVSITVTDNTLRSIAFHKFPIRMLSHIVEGDEAAARLAEREIFARKYFYPLTNHCTAFGFHGDETPVAKHISDRVLCLPLYPELAPEDVDRICEIIARPK